MFADSDMHAKVAEKLEGLDQLLGMKDSLPWVFGGVLVLVLLAFMIWDGMRRAAKSPVAEGSKPKELRHFIAYIFATGSGLMLLNSVVLFNLYAFGYAGGRIGFWSPMIAFGGSIISTGVAAIARYCDDK
jgi:hypothetical protein